MAAYSAGQRLHALHRFTLRTYRAIVVFLMAMRLFLPQALADTPMKHNLAAPYGIAQPMAGPLIHIFNGDTIQIPSGSYQTDERNFIVLTPAQFHIADGASLRLNGTLANDASSQHGLHKTGYGLLILSKASTLQGNTMLYQGALRLEHNQALGWEGRSLQAGSGTRIEYADGLSISHGLQLSDLMLPPGLPADPPILNVGQGVQWAVSQGSATHQGELLGNLPVFKLGQGELVLNGMALAYQGDFHLAEGALALNNMLGGNLQAEAGTRLSGRGQVQSLNLNGNVLFAPGLRLGAGSQAPTTGLDSQAVFRVSGNAYLHDDSTILIAVRPDGLSNQLRVGDTATLAGTLSIQAEGDWQNSVSYDIVQAQQIATGTEFGAWLINRDDLEATLSYGSDRVVLTLTPIHALSWEVQASSAAMRALLMDDSRFVRQAVLHQQRGNADLPDHPRAWAHAYRVQGLRHGMATQARGRRTLNGVVMGMDMPINRIWSTSVYGAAQHTQWQPGDSPASASADSVYLGAALTARRNAWQATLGLAYGRHNISGHARVARGSWQRQLTSSHHAHTTQLFVSASHQWLVNDTSIQPFLELAWVSQRTPSHQYQTSGAWLTAERSSDHMRVATLGVRVEQQLNRDSTKPLRLYAQAAWRYADTKGSLWTQWQGSGGAAVQSGRIVADASIARHALQTQLGAVWQVKKHWDLSLDYAGEYGSGNQDHQWMAQMQYRF